MSNSSTKLHASHFTAIFPLSIAVSSLRSGENVITVQLRSRDGSSFIARFTVNIGKTQTLAMLVTGVRSVVAIVHYTNVRVILTSMWLSQLQPLTYENFCGYTVSLQQDEW